MSPSSKKFGISALGVLVLALAVAQGCSSSDDSSQAAPTAGTSNGGGSSKGGSGGGASKGGSSSGGTSAGGTSAGGTSAGGTSGGGEAGTANPGDGGEGGAVDCNGPDGCYNCAPTNDTQFLNHCVAGGCQPAQDFHLPATLPALP